MKQGRFHILIIIAMMAAVAACSGDRAKVIPRSDMSRIYAEMLMVDQWVLSSSGMRQKADTSLVYEPIFEKYGYDSEDYLKSVEYYMRDPERYSRILRKVADDLDSRIVKLKLLLEEQKRRERMTHVPVDFSMADCDAYLSREPYIHYYDSLQVEADSMSLVYRIVPLHRSDTLYEGLNMIIVTDSLAVTDSLVVADSLVVTDSLAAADTLAADDGHLVVEDPKKEGRMQLHRFSTMMKNGKLDSLKKR